MSIRAADRCKSRTGIPALPFCQVRLCGQKPKDYRYPSTLNTIGDHLRKARLDRRLFQKDAAKELGVSEAAVYNWETGKAVPSIRSIPGIIRFLGYDPSPAPGSLSEQLVAARRRLGYSRRRLAHHLEIDESTLAKWETGRGRPSRKIRGRIELLLQLDKR
ncbi:helix-turn-helix domain-containing protein [Candidatus Binatus sp.]|uniref:helix-turn-helix domain-containing protein n=1 Tax=Candidatus Binatus sp. TaxID=2811406 RepID=UPI0039C87902